MKEERELTEEEIKKRSRRRLLIAFISIDVFLAIYLIYSLTIIIFNH